jgi:hypothetical protein
VASSRRPGRVLRQQALDPQGHLLQAPCRVEPGAGEESQVRGRGPRRLSAGHLEQGADARATAPGADALESLLHQDAVVAVQGDHIGHRPQGHQIKQVRQIGLRPLSGEPPDLPQGGPQGGEDVEDHPDPRQVLAREGAAGLIGVDDGGGVREPVPGQMVIGHQHRDAEAVGVLHPGEAGDPVVHRDDEPRPQGGGRVHHRGAQSVAVGEAARDQVGDGGRPEGAQAEHRQRAAGGPIGVVVADHQNGPSRPQGGGQHRHGPLDPGKGAVGQQSAEAQVSLRRVLAAPDIEPL